MLQNKFTLTLSLSVFLQNGVLGVNGGRAPLPVRVGCPLALDLVSTQTAAKLHKVNVLGRAMSKQRVTSTSAVQVRSPQEQI